jgi:diguanylate cyclase (GGDEF)-like protein
MSRNVCLFLFDMDLFKNINDTHGHATGDRVLKTVSATVKAQLQKTHCIGRLGGEEFSLCLPNLGDAEALDLAERCRAAMAASDRYPSGFTLPASALLHAVQAPRPALKKRWCRPTKRWIYPRMKDATASRPTNTQVLNHNDSQ